jgi:cardiolipin synthase
VYRCRVEYPLLHYASRGLYGTLLDAGIEIHEYHASLLHAKVAVVDTAFGWMNNASFRGLRKLTLRQQAN